MFLLSFFLPIDLPISSIYPSTHPPIHPPNSSKATKMEHPNSSQSRVNVELQRIHYPTFWTPTSGKLIHDPSYGRHHVFLQMQYLPQLKITFGYSYPFRPPDNVCIVHSSSSTSYHDFLNQSTKFIHNMKSKFRLLAARHYHHHRQQQQQSPSLVPTPPSPEVKFMINRFYPNGCPCCTSISKSHIWRPVHTTIDIYIEFVHVYINKQNILHYYLVHSVGLAKGLIDDLHVHIFTFHELKPPPHSPKHTN